jgi:hypothetical protein
MHDVLELGMSGHAGVFQVWSFLVILGVCAGARRYRPWPRQNQKICLFFGTLVAFWGGREASLTGISCPDGRI